jgi:O-antigen/teichoic acid export membrane protein
MNKFLKGSLLLTSAKFIDLFVDLLSVAIISRLFTLNEYGVYSQIFIVASFFTALINLGLPSSINFFLAREEEFEKKKEYLTNIIALVNFFGLICFAILFYFKGYISNYFDNPQLGNYAFIYALLPWMRLGIILRDNVFIVMDKVTNAIFNRIIMSIIRLSIPIIMMIFSLSFLKYLYLFILVEVILYLFVQLSILNLFKGLSIKSINIPKCKKILVYSIPLGLALTIGTINIQFDKIIIGKYFSTEQFAIYTNMSREIPVAALSASIVTIIMPTVISKLKVKQYKEVVDLWKKTMSFSLFVLSPIIVILLCMSEDAITVLYSDKYLDGVSVFRIYILILYFRVIYFGMILNAAGQTKKIFNSSLLSLILNILLSILFINIFGFTGPAWATLVAFLLITFYQLRETSIILDLKIIDLFPWENIFMILAKDVSLAVIIILLKVYILEPYAISSIWSLIIVTTVCILITIIFYLRHMKKRIAF